jgi:hypothetical protein
MLGAPFLIEQLDKPLSLFFFHAVHRVFGQNKKFLMTLSSQMNGRCVSALMQSVSLSLLPQTVLREFSDKLAKLGTPTTPRVLQTMDTDFNRLDFL